MLNEFIAMISREVDRRSIYAWGGQGQKRGLALTEAYIRQRERGTGGYDDGQSYADAAVALYKRRVAEGFGGVISLYDCSGLGVWALNELGLMDGDASANTLMGKCDKLSRSELKRGDWVFRVGGNGRAYHIGYVVDDALNVVEARGRRDGVVKRAIGASGKDYWNRFGRPKMFADEIDETATRDVAPKYLGKYRHAENAITNVRQESSVKAAIVDELKSGELVEVVEMRDDGVDVWCRIRRLYRADVNGKGQAGYTADGRYRYSGAIGWCVSDHLEEME